MIRRPVRRAHALRAVLPPQSAAFTSEFTRAIRSGYDAAASPRTIGNWSPMSEIYKTAKGEPLPGLEVRRNQESEMCLQGLAEARK